MLLKHFQLNYILFLFYSVAHYTSYEAIIHIGQVFLIESNQEDISVSATDLFDSQNLWEMSRKSRKALKYMLISRIQRPRNGINMSQAGTHSIRWSFDKKGSYILVMIYIYFTSKMIYLCIEIINAIETTWNLFLTTLVEKWRHFITSYLMIAGAFVLQTICESG